MKSHTTLLLATTLAFSASAAHATTVLYSEDFNNPNSATPLSNFDWSTFSGGAPSNPTIVSSGTTTGGIFDTQRAAHVNLNTTSATSSWFGGLRYTYAQTLPADTPLAQLSLTANVYAGGSVGPRGDVTLRLESSANNWIGWTVSGTTLTTNNGLLAGGLLSETTHSSGTFNPDAASFNIVLAFANTLSTWGNDNSNIIGIDNVSFTQIPEPSAYATLLGLAALTVVARRPGRR